MNLKCSTKRFFSFKNKYHRGVKCANAHKKEKKVCVKWKIIDFYSVTFLCGFDFSQHREYWQCWRWWGLQLKEEFTKDLNNSITINCKNIFSCRCSLNSHNSFSFLSFICHFRFDRWFFYYYKMFPKLISKNSKITMEDA